MGIYQAVEAAERGAQVVEELAPEASRLSEAVFQDSMCEVLRHPTKLIDALPRMAEIFEKGRADGIGLHLPELSKILTRNNGIAGTKITRFLGSGASQLAVATEDGTALKLGIEPVARLIPDPAFDAPVLDAGRVGSNFYYYKQPIGNTAEVEDRHALSVIRNIRSRGYIDDDMWDVERPRTGNVALFGPKQRPLLIDQWSALPRYGSAYENGALVPHPQQQKNLSEITDFLQKHGISLKKWSISRPQNLDNWMPHSLSAQVDDASLKDMVMDYLKAIGQPSTFARRWGHLEVRSWSSAEVDMALRSLAIRK